MTYLLTLSQVSTVQHTSELTVWAYVGFIALVMVFLALDLGVFHRDAHEVSMREAIGWSVVWLTCGVSFAGFVYFAYERHWLGLGLKTPVYEGAHVVSAEVSGRTAAVQYLTGYVIEKSLAMDNIFVIALIFSFFAVPARYQHRVLFWGIMGALVMRGGMIFLGSELIRRYEWVLIIFGAFLVVTAIKMALIKSETDPGKNIVVRLVRRCWPVTDFYDGQKFFTRRTEAPVYRIDPATGLPAVEPPRAGTLRAGWAVTPLFLALILVEITDLVFAVDSIPAIFAITPDPFIVFTSNIFAILGLRSLYFCLAAMIARFRFLKPALILILAFVGVKLLLLSVPPHLNLLGFSPSHPIKIGTGASLLVIMATLATATLLSILFPTGRSGRGQPGIEPVSPA